MTAAAAFLDDASALSPSTAPGWRASVTSRPAQSHDPFQPLPAERAMCIVFAWGVGGGCEGPIQRSVVARAEECRPGSRTAHAAGRTGRGCSLADPPARGIRIG